MSLLTAVTTETETRRTRLSIHSVKAMNKWPNPELSLGIPCLPLGRNKCWEVVGPAQKVTSDIYKATKALLESHGDHLYETERTPCLIMFGLYMIGKSEDTASPTLLFSCEAKDPRRKAMRLAKDDQILKNYSGVRLAESSRLPVAYRRPTLLAYRVYRRPPPQTLLYHGYEIEARPSDTRPSDARPSYARPSDARSSDARPREAETVHYLSPTVVYCVPANNICGAPLYTELTPGYTDTKVQKSTLGGILQLGGQLFGLTVAHAFIESSRYNTATSHCDSEFAFDDDGDEDDEDENDGDTEMTDIDFTAKTSEGSISSENGSTIISDALEDQSATEDDIFEPPDRLPTSHIPSKNPLPALMDILDDSILGVETLGSLDIRSPKRFCTEFDWALVEIKNPLFQTSNLVIWEENNQKRELYPERFRNLGPIPKDVLLVIKGRGIIRGTSSGTPTYMRWDREFHEVWTIRTQASLSKGDSGAWVIDPDNGDLYGHVVAGIPGANVAYIMPIEAILKSMKTHVGTQLFLPQKQAAQRNSKSSEINSLWDNEEESDSKSTTYQTSIESSDDTNNFQTLLKSGPTKMYTQFAEPLVPSSSYRSYRVSPPRNYDQFPNYQNPSEVPIYQQEVAYVKPTPRNLDWTPETPLWKLYEVVVRNKKVSHLALLPDRKPTSQTPPIVYLDQRTDHDGHHCLFPGGCRGKQNVFKRPADLDRHQIQVHAPEPKEKFYCNYKRCERSKSEGTKPFFRKDHYRDHLKDFHKEDLLRKKFLDADAKQKWLEERVYDLSWWRCGKCLEKTLVSKDGYTCRRCNARCEDERVSIRQRLAESGYSRDENTTTSLEAGPSHPSSCLMCQGHGYVRDMYGGWLECSVCKPVTSLGLNTGNEGYDNGDSNCGRD